MKYLIVFLALCSVAYAQPAPKIAPKKKPTVKKIVDTIHAIQLNHVLDSKGNYIASYVLFWRKFRINRAGGGSYVRNEIIAWVGAGNVALSKEGAMYKVEWMDNGIKRVVESIVFREDATPFDVEVEYHKQHKYPSRGLTTPFEASLIAS